MLLPLLTLIVHNLLNEHHGRRRLSRAVAISTRSIETPCIFPEVNSQVTGSTAVITDMEHIPGCLLCRERDGRPRRAAADTVNTVCQSGMYPRMALDSLLTGHRGCVNHVQFNESGKQRQIHSAAKILLQRHWPVQQCTLAMTK